MYLVGHDNIIYYNIINVYYIYIYIYVYIYITSPSWLVSHDVKEITIVK